MLAKNKRASVETVKSAQTISFLLDYAPQTWCSRDDHYLRLAEALVARGVKPILVFSKEPPDAVSVPLRSCGAEVAAIDYGKGIAHYYRELGKLVRMRSDIAIR